MKRRRLLDAIVVGGGVVGSACALSLAHVGLDVTLIEAATPPEWSPTQHDLRVYAFAPDNAAFLESLGVWQSIRNSRVQPYRKMRVWDAAWGEEFVFDADALGRTQLGWIIEHSLLADRLWTALPAAGVDVRQPARLEKIQTSDDRLRLQFDDGAQLACKIAIAADGADSTLRTLAGIGIDSHDYAQRAIVAYVDTEQPHRDTAWQRFLPRGPIAFLPFLEGKSSIVWTLPSNEAEHALKLDDHAFGEAVTHAFAARLGQVAVVSSRAAFPLRRQLARAYATDRVLLMGDAAHVVHPLAGQGVNLGLRDAAALQAAVISAQRKGVDFDRPHRLQQWARERKSQNALAAYAFDGINRMFSNDDLFASVLRGPMLGLAGRIPPLANLLWRRASGQ